MGKGAQKNLVEKLIAELENERKLMLEENDDKISVVPLGTVKLPLGPLDEAFFERLRNGYRAIIDEQKR